MTIICKEHGSFEQKPRDHKRGHGCTLCGNNICSPNANQQRHSKAKVISAFIDTHGDTYDYSLVEYKNIKTKVIIICKEHGPFEQTPGSHKIGRGCNDCRPMKNTRVTYLNRPTTLYYIQINKPDHPTVFKIGLTLESVSSRYYSDIKNGVIIETLMEWNYSDGAQAWDKEQEILYAHLEDVYLDGKSNILLGGNTEIFYCDILKLA